MSYVVLKDIFIVSSILSLILVGCFITLKSGLMSIGGHHGRLVLGNLTHLLVSLMGCLLLFIMVQEFIGIRIGFNR